MKYRHQDSTNHSYEKVLYAEAFLLKPNCILDIKSSRPSYIFHHMFGRVTII